ncbi:CAP domain-containing protein [Niastella caeni]|uniref:CAP domain-containing protein n=1 Tax=Niastella caeni TaxID=2569763 RepID=A0A4S8HKT6_9BACT|nr:CAP domain-containing protein [Niastella caeni]THU35900.1 CAP domain-containing protein [Niastella caeni]
MKVISYMVPVVMLLLSFFYNNNPFVVKEEAQQAFQLLNTIRSNPEKYYKELHLNAKLTITKKALRWNDTLAKVAEAKALDMAKRNYFNHVNPDGYGINYFIQQSGYKLNADWLKDKKENFFESLATGHDSGTEAIKSLIIDAGDASKGHRDHLLGIGDWDASLYDIGIGFVKCDGGKYQSYTCIIIAKHDW